jgi:uncharacterized protein
VAKTRRGPRYTPVSRRQDRPDAIAWLLRYHPELSDAQIIKLVGTTKPTIQSIRDRTHWNSSRSSSVDPVTLGLCSQLDLDLAVQKAASRIAKTRPTRPRRCCRRARRPSPPPDDEAAAEPGQPAPEPSGEPDYDPDQVLARLQALRREPDEGEDDDDKKD